MSPPTDRVRVTFEGDLALVTLTRPDKHNGMDFAMLDAVVAAQGQVRRRREFRAVLLRGDGPSFCAGLDFKAVSDNPWGAARRLPQLLKPWRNTFQQWSLGWRDLGVPMLACVHGNCFGAGLQLALGPDLRFCTPAAQISVMEAKWGLVPDMGGAVIMRELVRADVAKELTMTGRILTGEQAGALGLVTHVVDDPETAARALAAELATRSPDSVAASKLLIQDAYAQGAEAVAAAAAELAAGADRRVELPHLAPAQPGPGRAIHP